MFPVNNVNVFHSRSRLPILLAAALASATIATGCGSNGAAPQANSSKAEPLSAGEIVAEMANAYRQLTSYADDAEYKQLIVERGDAVERTYPLQSMPVIFARPNKLRVSMQRSQGETIVFYAHVLSDGNRVRHAISDIPDQILEAVAPLVATIDNFISSADLREVLVPIAIEDLYPQLALLCADEDHPPPFVGDTTAELLEPDTIAERRCHRVQLTSDQGQRVLWIDQETFLLRRMIIPSRLTKEKLDPNDELEQFTERIDFNIVEIDADIPDVAFEMDLPEGVARVREFIEPPPDPPHSLIGKTVDDFALHELDGTTLSRESLAGDIVLLEFWFMGCQFCSESMPHIDTVFQKYRDESRVRILAVSVDHASVEAQQLQERLRSWGTEMPIVRDTNRGHEAGAVLGIRGFPTTVLLGPDGRVQQYLFGNQTSYQPVDDAIAALLDGRDPALNEVKAYNNALRAYQERLVAVSVDDDGAQADAPSEDAGPTGPSSFSWKKLWSTANLDRPRELHVLPPRSDQLENGPSVIIVSGEGVVQTLSATGAVVRTEKIERWDSGPDRFLRWGDAKSGERFFVAGRHGGAQLEVFDGEWQSRLVFPPETRHEIGDAALTDLDGDGELDLVVGYWGDLGVQRVSLAGKRSWAERTVGPVVQLTAGLPDSAGARRVYSTSAEGVVYVLNQQGRRFDAEEISDQAVLQVAVADFENDGEPQRCAIIVTDTKRLAAVGFDKAGQEIWRRELSSASEPPLTRAVTASQLPDGRPCWFAVAPDNSIYWIAPDGQLIDQASYGQQIDGMGAGVWDGAPVLVLATGKDVTAWQLASSKTD